MDGTTTTLSLLRSSTTIRHLHQIHAQMIKTQQAHSLHLAGRLISSVALRHSPHTPYALSILSRLPSPPRRLHSQLHHPRLPPLRLPSPLPPLLRPPLRRSPQRPHLPSPPQSLHSPPLASHRPRSAFVRPQAWIPMQPPHTNRPPLPKRYSRRFYLCPQTARHKSSQRETATWNAILSGLVKSGRSRDAMDLFYMLLMEGAVEADEITVVSALAACADVGALGATRWVHEYAARSGIEVNVYVGTALVDAYAKCGSVESAREVFDEMKERNVMSWTAMICGAGMFGRGDEAIVLFDRMVGEGVRPDDVTFIGVLSACSHSGMVGEGCRVFGNMSSVFKIAPKTEHYGCMVDMLSGAGLLDETLDLVEEMPMEADTALWGSLLSACRRNPAKVELAEYAAGHLMEINESTYVLLSNIYAHHNRWDDVGRVRIWMKAQGIEKTPGCSSVEVSGVVHEFIAGTNRTHISARYLRWRRRLNGELGSWGT